MPSQPKARDGCSGAWVAPNTPAGTTWVAVQGWPPACCDSANRRFGPRCSAAQASRFERAVSATAEISSDQSSRWHTLSGQRVVVHATPASYAAQVAASELREAEAAVAVLEELLQPPHVARAELLT